jgi:Spy/CpxP family protein refolding chaperone
MTKSHKIITAFGAIALSATLAFAATETHEGGHHHGRHGQFGARLAKKLNLTDAQKEQAKANRTAFFEQNKDFFAQARATRQELHAAKEANDTAKVESLKATLQSQHAQMKQLRQQQEAQFESILTPDQRAQFEQMKAERAAKRAERDEQH